MSDKKMDSFDKLSENVRPQFEEELGEKTRRKFAETPLVPLGVLGFFTAVAYGVKTFKNRPAHMRPSMFVMRFRVFAQSIAVGAMVATVGYNMFKVKVLHEDPIIGGKKD